MHTGNTVMDNHILYELPIRIWAIGIPAVYERDIPDLKKGFNQVQGHFPDSVLWMYGLYIYRRKLSDREL
jgi:hypothetical protein